MYKLLTNTTYLYLIQHPEEHEQINYTKIAQETMRTRQTISSEYQYILNNHIDYQNNILNITNFYNEIANPTQRAICIYLDLTSGVTTKIQTARALGRGHAAIHTHWQAAYDYWEKTQQNKLSQIVSGVYAALYNNQIIYIGSTTNMNKRIKEHIKAIQNNTNDSPIAQYCNENNISVEEITFQPLIYTLDYKEVEVDMIHTIAPVCNTMSQLKKSM